jgi:RND family efflux transporter MFP subunit
MAETSRASSGAAPAPGIRRFFSAALVLAVVLVTWGEAHRLMARNALRQRAAVESTLAVATVRPTRSEEGEKLVLPGTVQAYIESPIYARTNGYLKSWYTDIGGTVRKGQLLAEIDAPEVDQQLAQAVADLATARANEALSNTTDRRWRGLLATESVSQQDADEKAGDAAAKRAAAASAAANVSRLRELESFKRVLAPFDGVVTARNTDIGALINAGQSVGSELFRVADTSKLRIYVRVPEPYAGAAQPGVRAELRFSEQPGKSYTATTVRTSNALDPTLRTLQVELELDNARHEIFPGAYAEVHFSLPGNAHSLRLPATTVLFRAPGPQVATVDSHNRVQLKSIVQGRDFGSSIEVLAGLDDGDQVVVNPPDAVIDGVFVHVLSPAASQPSKVAKAP